MYIKKVYQWREWEFPINRNYLDDTVDLFVSVFHIGSMKYLKYINILIYEYNKNI